MSLRGIIVAGDADERLAMISIVLSTDHELDFAIERNAKGDELFEHLRDSVWVKGFIGDHKKGKKSIRITDYEIMERGRLMPARTNDWKPLT